MKGKKEKKKTTVSTVIRVILITIIIILIGVGAYCLSLRCTHRESVPMPFGYGIAVVRSGSMEPAIHLDDVIIVKKTKDYKVGDIVMYRGNASTVTHRIVAIDGNMVTTQGDANNAPDEPIEYGMIMGEVIGKLPQALSFIGSDKTPRAIVFIIAIMIIIAEASHLICDKGDEDEEEDEREALREELRKLKGEKDEREEGR